MEQRPLRPTLERIVQVMDRPLLVLAVLAVLLYKAYLAGWFDGRTHLYTGISLVIDLVFVADLCLKFIAYGRSYLLTPWCLIDALSCVPILDTLGAGLDGAGAIRFIRAMRVFRVLRALRVLRVLRTMPVFERLAIESSDVPVSTRYKRALAGGVVAFTLLFLVLVVVSRRHAETRFIGEMQQAIQAGADVQGLGGAVDPILNEHTLSVTAGGRQVYFPSRLVDRYAHTSELYLLIGTVVTMTLFLFLLNVQLRDASYGQLHGLLNIALPRQVVKEFLRRPQSYTEKARDSATVLFMDFVGFTRTCEMLKSDVDTLARNLEMVMDCVVEQLNKYDLIIDKFIGDAIMCFRGGPLVEGTPGEHAERGVRGALAAGKALAKLKNPYFSRLKIGGASASHCLIGAFGTSTRLSYTTLGDGVNLAARLEPASGQCQTENLFCSTTYELCSGMQDVVWRRWGQIRVPGKSHPEHVFEALDAEAIGDRQFLEHYAAGLACFENRQFAQARELFTLADQSRDGGDPPSRYYVEWCTALIDAGVPDDWAPVLPTKK